MRENILSEVYAIFNPREPLRGDKFKYYVDRRSGIGRVVWEIKSSREPLKIPNIALFDREARRNDDNWEIMHKIVERRVKELGLPLQTIISEEALELAIGMSGGVIHDFIRIIRESAVNAYINKRNRIEKEDVDAYAIDLRNDYLRVLTGKDLD